MSTSAAQHFELSLARILDDARHEAPEHVVLEWQGQPITVAALADTAGTIAAALKERGCAAGARVMVMLDNHPDHVATILALALLGVVWLPVDRRLKADSIAHLLATTAPCGAIVESAYQAVVREAGYSSWLITREELSALVPARFARGRWPGPDDIRSIMFTSGTTGPSKGVIVSERMLSAASYFATAASACRAHDRFLLWEPLVHIGGAQMIPLALRRRATLVMVPEFSAAQFWDQVRGGGVNKLHYLGGVLDILLKRPPLPGDRDHSIALAFGGGAKPHMWRACEQRFGIRLVEVYGMTEASSFCTLNAEGIVGSIGRPFANFQIEILRADGTPAGIKERGEIVLQADPPGLLTPGYLNDPAGSAALLRDGRLYTGDLGYRDASGHFYFSGRKKESIRRRGENISAWEVEQVLNGHPAVKESAVVGVQAAIGEEEILAYVLPNLDRAPNPQDLLEWCVRRLADFQVPRYIRFVPDFERTPSNRIRKSVLSRDPAGAWDVECQRAGHLTSSSSSGEKSGNISAIGPFTR